MLTQDFSLKLKLLDDAGTFTGYASTYGGPADLVGDIIEPGAFAQSIAQQGKGYPLLWSHRPDEPIGLAKVSDDPKGLKVDGSLVLADPAAQRAYTHLKAGTIRGMSIGYDVPHGEGKILYSDDGTRTLKEIKLYEISLVAIPANPKAQVTSVKSLPDVMSVLRGLRDATDPAIVAQLRSIDAELKRLLRKDSNCQCDCPECISGNCINCTNPDCIDPNCEANWVAAELAALKSFDVSLKRLVASA
jgi:HK97 family phage prohead protease